jgi:hypothetical protein
MGKIPEIPPKKARKDRLDTPRLFDLVFKRLIRLSPGAVIRFINGLFGTSHPPESSVDYPNTETGGRSTYHVEVQSTDDAEIAVRVFEYGFAQALRTKTVDANVTTVQFPEARVIYVNPSKATPGEVRLRLEFPGGGCDYAVKSFKLFDYSLQTLRKKNMLLLLPFYVLKLRRAVEAAKTVEERGSLSRQMRAILESLVETIGGGVRKRVLTKTDGRMLIEYSERLFREVYMGYTEFKESNIMKDLVLTYSEEAVLKARSEDAKRYREREKKTQRKTMLRTARKMKELNLPAEQIAIVSGLSPAEIAKL